MALIYDTANFILESHDMPEIDRLEGGHVVISPKKPLEDRTMLSPQLAIELMRFTIIVGKAMKRAMKRIGVDIGRINYQENGNWKPHLHIHVYCRAKNAKMQQYGKPIIPGHKDAYKPLNEVDIGRITEEIEYLFGLKDFSDSQWGLS